MEKSSKNQSNPIKIIAFLSLLVLVVGLGSYFLIYKNNPSKKVISGPIPPRQLIEINKYSTEEYVMPLENNGAGSIYSSRVQIRGRIQDIVPNRKEFAVTSASKLLRVTIPDPVQVMCIPSVFTDAKGQQVDSKHIFLDFHLLSRNNNGKMLDFPKVSSVLKVNSDLTLIAGVSENDHMTAEFIAGYDCTL